MNIYDFDNTIFDGDSSFKFFKYSLKRHSFLVLKSLIKSLKDCLKYIFGKSDLGNIKSTIFSFVKDIDNLDEYIDLFIIKNMSNIKKFYLDNQKDNDVIISASFEFIIKPFCEKLGIKNVIATKYDIHKGKIIGKNCKGKEKIVRFSEYYNKEDVECAYSDSLSDLPMFEIAKQAYLVEGNVLKRYK